MVVASVMAIVHLLLVLSGDVEENPGPLGQHTKGKMNMSLPNLLSNVLFWLRPTGFAVQ